MKASVIKIGNSRGIRIPKPVFAACGFENEVEMEIRDGALVIRSAHRARIGWNEAFQGMAKTGDDALISPEIASTWDSEEWQWK
jgi:antitoxin MazE